MKAFIPTFGDVARPLYHLFNAVVTIVKKYRYYLYWEEIHHKDKP
jgi:hypothetical protein